MLSDNNISKLVTFAKSVDTMRTSTIVNLYKLVEVLSSFYEKMTPTQPREIKIFYAILL